MSEADRKNRHIRLVQLFNFFYYRGALLRISRAVGKHDSIRIRTKNFLCRGKCRINGHFTAALCKASDDVVLGAVIQKRNAKARLSLCGTDRRLFSADLGDNAPHRIIFQRVEHFGHRVADHGVHRALLAQHTGERAGVKTAKSGDVVFLQKFVQGVITAKIRGCFAFLADNIAAHRRFSLEILLDYTVISDKRKGLNDDLSGVAFVGQRFDIPLHAGGKHKLADAVARRADAFAFKHTSVAQYQKCHNVSHRISVL